ncbi:hypothetical protein QL285_031842 [Trifolium repens]|nr:hypothetical protein QL285_031842 [Trifolium repens]
MFSQPPCHFLIMWIMGSSSFLNCVIMEVVGGFFFLDELTMSGGRLNLRPRRPHSVLPVNIEFESSGSLIGPFRIGPRKSRPVHSPPSTRLKEAKW